MKRSMVVLLVLSLGLLATARLASAAGMDRGAVVGAKGAIQTSVVWGGGQAASPQGLTKPEAAKPTYIIWQWNYISSPVNRRDWSPWLGWLNWYD